MKRILPVLALILTLSGCWWVNPALNTGPNPAPTPNCSFTNIDLGGGGTYLDVTGATPTTSDDGVHDCIINGEIAVQNSTAVAFKNVKWRGLSGATCGGDTNGTCYALRVLDSSDVIIQDSEMTGPYNAAGIYINLNSSGSFLMERSEIHHLGDDFVRLSGFGNTVFQNNWMHDIQYAHPESGPHADGIQTQCGLENTSISGNIIDMGSAPGGNAAIFVDPNFCSGGDSAHPLQIAFNRLSCASCNFTVRLYMVASAGPYYQTGVTFQGNAIYRGGVACSGGGNACTSWIHYGTPPWVYLDGLDVFNENVQAENCPMDPGDPGAFDYDNPSCVHIPSPI